MSVTGELHRMLDDRGVEYQYNKGTKVFHWDCDGANDGIAWFTATEVDGGINMMASNLTPEQAIEATLGRGTCRIMKDFKCSACGHVYPHRNCTPYETEDGRLAWKSLDHWELSCATPNFCPNCGRKVVDA